ncbi:MAG: TIGR02391 family protein [Alphaproteobacteria bacterium]|nr:TIGR02391 family protein [Alphaproteobacteria bacterium]
MNDLGHFERIARTAKNVGRLQIAESTAVHPFDERNIHPDIGGVSQKLFDNGHYSQSTFEAFKLLDNKVKTVAGNSSQSGFKLMMEAFNEANPKIKLTDLGTQSEIDEQNGFRFIFAGSMWAIRNPRGHDILTDPIDLCLDHLSFASVLLRTLEDRKSPKP